MTAVLLFLRGVPLWVWLALGLLGAGLFYGHLRYNAGQADVQADWDAEKAAFQVKLAEADAAVAVKSAAIQSAYDAGVQSAKDMRDKETSDAYARGKAAGERIRAGTSSVRTVWRDRECPASADGSGAGSGEGAAEVSGERADLIGSLLGQAGSWDATYSEALRRLEQAQKIVDACYEEPAR